MRDANAEGKVPDAGEDPCSDSLNLMFFGDIDLGGITLLEPTSSVRIKVTEAHGSDVYVYN